MARLTAKRRRNLKKNQFAGPGRSFPVDTRARAVNAKARATQAYKAGRISKSAMQKIKAKANKKLKKKKG